ncbi:MAG: hypothetical protein WCO00_10095 [Rhodospirillaceae bacterium]
MSYSSGIAGGPTLSDRLRYRQEQTSRQGPADSASAAGWPGIGQAPGQPPPTSPMASSGSTPQSTAPATAAPAAGIPAVSSEISSLFLQFQQMLSQFEPSGEAAATAEPSSSTSAEASTTTASSDSAPPADAARPPRHRHHRQGQGVTAAAGSASDPAATSDPLARLFSTAGDGAATASSLFSQLAADSGGTGGGPSDAQTALRQLLQVQGAAGLQALSGGLPATGPRPPLPAGRLSGASLLLSAQQMGQAA